ncbi:hypothetical protein D3C76_922880 [compost metagenome]
MNVLLAQAVLVAVLDAAFAGVNQKQALAPCTASFVENDDAGGNTCAEKQVCRQTDNGLDIALLKDALADHTFSSSTKQHTVGQNHCSLAGAL